MRLSLTYFFATELLHPHFLPVGFVGACCFYKSDRSGTLGGSASCTCNWNSMLCMKSCYLKFSLNFLFCGHPHVHIISWDSLSVKCIKKFPGDTFLLIHCLYFILKCYTLFRLSASLKYFTWMILLAKSKEIIWPTFHLEKSTLWLSELCIWRSYYYILKLIGNRLTVCENSR